MPYWYVWHPLDVVCDVSKQFISYYFPVSFHHRLKSFSVLLVLCFYWVCKSYQKCHCLIYRLRSTCNILQKTKPALSLRSVLMQIVRDVFLIRAYASSFPETIYAAIAQVLEKLSVDGPWITMKFCSNNVVKSDPMCQIVSLVTLFSIYFHHYYCRCERRRRRLLPSVISILTDLFIVFYIVCYERLKNIKEQAMKKLYKNTMWNFNLF